MTTRHILAVQPDTDLAPVAGSERAGGRAAPHPSVPERTAPRPGRRLPPGAVAAVLAGLLIAGVLLAAGSGQLHVSPGEVGQILARAVGLDFGGQLAHPHAEATILTVRLPRVVMALAVGAALGVAGAVMQGVFANPLAEPGVVGVSAGAATAACLAIVCGANVLGEWSIAAAAFVGGLLTCAAVYVLSRRSGRTDVVTMLLTGIAVNAIAGAGIAAATYLADSADREQIVFWQLGSLNGSRWVYVGVVVPLTAAGIGLAFAIARRLDLLALGERGAAHLGVRVERLRGAAIVTVAVLAAGAVAFCGVIAFVGLIVPHALRLLVGPSHRALLPLSALGGAALLLLADTAARSVVPYADLPLGMLIALVGGPTFLYLVRRTRAPHGVVA